MLSACHLQRRPKAKDKSVFALPEVELSDASDDNQGDGIAARHGPVGNSYSSSRVQPIELWVRRKEPVAPDPHIDPEAPPQSEKQGGGSASEAPSQQGPQQTRQLPYGVPAGSIHASQLGLPGWYETVQPEAAQQRDSPPEQSSQVSISTGPSLSVDFQQRLCLPGAALQHNFSCICHLCLLQPQLLELLVQHIAGSSWLDQSIPPYISRDPGSLQKSPSPGMPLLSMLASISPSPTTQARQPAVVRPSRWIDRRMVHICPAGLASACAGQLTALKLPVYNTTGAWHLDTP